MILQIATALTIGAYVVLSKDAQCKRPDATPRESFQRPADHLLDRDSSAPDDTPSFRLPHPATNSSEVGPRAVITANAVYGAAILHNASIEYFPAPLTNKSKKPPMMLRFL
jgi:hypothetical protein